MAKVVVFGVSQWAELAHFYLTHDSPHEVVAFTLDRDYIESPSYKDCRLFPSTRLNGIIQRMNSACSSR